MRFAWKKLTEPSTPRRPRRMEFSWDNLEDRKVLSHAGAFHHLQAAVHAASTTAHSASATVQAASTSSTTSTAGSTTSTTTSATSTPLCGGSGSSSSNTALTAALKTLQADVQTIESASGTTVAELTAIRTSFQALKADGLTPTSQSALQSFENSLVTAYTGGTTLAGDATLLGQFEALYTTSPTTQETTDLTTAYNALAAAVTSSNITSANVTTVDTDYAAVLSAEGNTGATTTFPYFTLVTGQGFGGFGGFGGHGHGGFGGRF